MIVYAKCRHPYTEENSYDWHRPWRKGGKKRRCPRCRTCQSLKQKIRWRSDPVYRAKLLAQSKAWAKRNREKRKQIVRRWAAGKGPYLGEQHRLPRQIYKDLRRYMIQDGAWPTEAIA